MVELGNLAGTRAAQWIGRPQHEELQRKVRPLLPSDDPFYQPPSGFSAPNPARCCAPATSNWRFWV